MAAQHGAPRQWKEVAVRIFRNGVGMERAGYVYALINPSFEGLVKIGRTTREPDDRVRELSAASGVPTPFVLAYDIYVEDCEAAEEYVHALLERRGYRVAENREFFNAPLKEVIRAMLDVERQPPAPSLKHTAAWRTPAHGVPAAPRPQPPPWADILDEAQAYYHGEGDTLEDKKEALKRFQQAAKLGAPEAYFALGVMHRDGEGLPADPEQALEFFKTGVAHGSDECHAEMGILYTRQGHQDNARKCWKKYFASDGFRHGGSGHEAAYAHAYLESCFDQGLEPEFRDALVPIRDAILQIHDDPERRAGGNGGAADRRKALKRFLWGALGGWFK